MNDDELGQFLRGEVPAPGPGYWEQIDARLHEAAGEGAIPEVPEEIPASVQTDDNVIRLTDMNDTIASTRNRFVGLIGVAAVLALLVGLAVVLTQNDSDDPDLDVAVPGVDDTSPDDGTDIDPDTTPDDDATDGLPDAGPSDEPVEDNAAPPPPGSEILSDIEPGTFTSLVENAELRQGPDKDMAVVASIEPGGTVEISASRVLADGLVFLQITAPADITGLWAEARSLLRNGQEGPDAEIEFLSDGQLDTYTVIDRSSVIVNADPQNVPTDLVTLVDALEEIDTTGRRAVSAGLEWWEVTTDQGLTGWAPSEFLVPAATDVGPSRLCYFDDASLLVLIFAAGDPDTFVGAFDYEDSIETVTGARVTDLGSVFDVTSSPIGSSEDGAPTVTEERWTAGPDGMNVGDRALLTVVACADFADRVNQLSEFTGIELAPVG